MDNLVKTLATFIVLTMMCNSVFAAVPLLQTKSLDQAGTVTTVPQAKPPESVSTVKAAPAPIITPAKLDSAKVEPIQTQSAKLVPVKTVSTVVNPPVPAGNKSGYAEFYPKYINVTYMNATYSYYGYMIDTAPNANISRSPMICVINKACNFDGTASTDDHGITNYTWYVDFGGGERPDPNTICSVGGNVIGVSVTSTVGLNSIRSGSETVVNNGRNPGPLPYPINVYGVTPNYTYKKTGSYPISLAVTDIANHMDYDNYTLEVVESATIAVNHPADITVNQSGPASIAWTATATYPDDFVIKKNGTAVFSGGYLSGIPIGYVVDTSTAGVFNYTINVRDQTHTMVSDEVIVTVTPGPDTAAPVIAGPVSMIVPQGSTNSVTWTITDANPSDYKVFVGGTNVASGKYTSGVGVSYAIDTSALGNFNYSIWANDTYGNSATNDVSVRVVPGDVTAPVLTHPADMSVPINSWAQISWTATEDYPASYAITVNGGAPVANGPYASGTPIVVTVNTGVAGQFNYTITVNDTSSNSASDVVTVDVTTPADTTAPDITGLGNITVAKDSVATVSWTVTEAYPHRYDVSVGGTSIASGAYASGALITVPADTSALGTFNYTITANDTSGNSATFVTEVNVVAEIDNTAPVVIGTVDISVPINSWAEVSWSVIELHPDTYEMGVDGSIASSGPYLASTPMPFLVNTSAAGVYNYTLWANDTFGNSGYDEIIVTVTTPADTTAPVIAGPADFYVVKDSSANVSWTVTEAYPHMGVLFVDGTQVASGPYINGVPITLPVNTSALGTFNYTMFVNDTSGNSATDEVMITVVPDMDTTAPAISSPADISAPINSFAEVSWTITDAHPDSYEIMVDGTPVASGAYMSGTAIAYTINTSVAGFYNYTITANDTFGNIATDEVAVTVTTPADTTAPTISSPPDMQVTQGSTQFITWVVNETYPHMYVLSVGGTPVASGAYTNGAPITLPINTSALGTFNYTISVNDTSGNSATDEVTVRVVSTIDTTAPNITGPADMTVPINSFTEVSWTITDDNPDSYEIRAGNVTVASGVYASGATITYVVDTTVAGTFNYTIFANDTLGNSAIDEVAVEVSATPDTTVPVIAGPADMAVPIYSYALVSWTVNEAYPHMYEVYENGTKVASGRYRSGEPITFVANTSDNATLNYTLFVNDTSGNSATDEVIVSVTWPPDTTAPNISSPADISVYAGDAAYISWQINESYPHMYVVSRDGTPIQNGTYTDGQTITRIVDTSSAGTFIYRMFANDTSGNSVYDDVVVVVVSRGGNNGGGGTGYVPYFVGSDSGSIHSKETVVETTVEVPVQPIISLQESKIYLLANSLAVSRDYYYDPNTNQTRYTLKVKYTGNESVKLTIKEVVPKTFANTTAGFKVKPVPTTVYEEDPVIGWEVVLGPNQVFTVTYQFDKKLELADVQSLEAPEITVSTLEEQPEVTTVKPKPETTVAPAGITGFVTGVFGNLALGIVVFIIALFAIAYYWKGEYIREGLDELRRKLRLKKKK
jgi:hypothetical protein